MSARVDVFSEPDLVTLLSDEPELLAVADAIATTRPIRRPRRLWPAVMAASLAVVVGLAVVAVWERTGSASLVERALAAVGEGPVVHVVIEEPTENVYVELDSGERTPQLRQVELWIDEGRSLEHELIRIDGRVVEELLVTPELLASPHPPVYTCAWITAHPAAAKKARVSCDPKDAHLGYTPQLDPALANFVDGYRSALQNGTAKESGKGEVDGRPVTWLSLQLDNGRTAEIAVDEDTGKPVRVREGGRTYDVLLLETLGASEGNFRAAEQRRPQPVYGSAGAEGPIPVTKAPEWVPGALWPGPTVRGLSLSEVELQFPTTGFGPDSDRPVQRGVGVTLVYGDSFKTRIQQSRAPQMAYGWYLYAIPRPGTVLLPGGWLVKDGVYVRVWSLNPDVVLEVARALRPIAG